MNFSTVLGMGTSIVLILIAAVLTTKQPGLLWDPLSFVIVFGGTFAAVFIAFPTKEVLRVFRVLLIVLRNEKLYTMTDVEELSRVTKVLSRGTIADAEKVTKSVANPFLRLGLELVHDGATPAEISGILGFRIDKLKVKEQAEANVFRAMASFAPALGMIGTLLGLVNMLSEIGADIVLIGFNLAVALMTTLYGVVGANLFFRPIAIKLEHRTQQRVELMNLVMEGILLVQQRRSPAMLRETMKAYTAEHKDELGASRRR